MTTDVAEPRTAAQQQAETTFPLSRHLADHPELPPVTIDPVLAEDQHPDGQGRVVKARCHLAYYGQHRAASLAAWADTLLDTTITAQVVPGHWLDADVYVVGALTEGGPYICVWASVHGLSAHVELLAHAHASPDTIVPVLLEQLRDHEPEPRAGELPLPAAAAAPQPDAAVEVEGETDEPA